MRYTETTLFSGQNITYDTPQRNVLHHVNLTLERNKITTLIGPNGSGKTTLAKIILGLTTATHGDIYRKAGIAIGYMPQKFAIEPVLPLTVKRFLTLRPNGYKHSASENLETISKEVGISHILAQQMYHCSGGEVQRILLARSLMGNPDLLVLDEPVQGLDIRGQNEFYRLIQRIRTSRGCGVLMISHDLHMVMANTDHVICMNHHICCEGTPQDVSKHPEYIALFSKEGIENMGLYTHHHDHEHGVAGEVKE